MEELMFGSVHTHFEDMFDTANDLDKMVLNFASLGAKRVALTGHGSMFAYEDLKAVVNTLKEKGKLSEDFEIIPGVEVYFEDEAAHMVLVAKDYEGYSQICQVITESAKNSKASKNTAEDVEYLTPIVTLDNLKSFISGGHVFATSACVGGVFGRDLGLMEHKLREKYDKELKKAQIPELDEALDLIDTWNAYKDDVKYKAPTKAEREKANKLAAKGDYSLFNELYDPANGREANSQWYKTWKEENKPAYEAAKKLAKKSESLKEKVDESKKTLDDYEASYDERFSKASSLYREFENIFGKENFYFELQNHGLESEKTAFNNVVKLAYSVGNPNFIASNDVHIGDRKGTETWSDSVLKRRVEKFNRFKSIDVREDEEEYGIKTDAELRAELLKIIEPAGGHTAEEIVDSAIGHIRSSLENCRVQFPEISINGINFYPKYCDNETEVFEKAVYDGMNRLFPDGYGEEYKERLEYEMGIIKQMGYCGYHLIVKDYLEYGRLLGYLRTQEEIDNAPLSIEELNKYIDDNNIPRVGMGKGPGRGSAAGCLCAYALGIVDTDPIRYGLMFERFLNPSRATMPDIDSDFKEDIRDKVYDYIKARYGENCVSKVCTKAYAYGKAACGIASRFLAEEKKMQNPSISKNEADEIKHEYLIANSKASKDIDSAVVKYGLNKTSVTDAGKAIGFILEDPGEYILTDKEVEVLKLAKKIEGIPSTLSMHACACIISGTDLGKVIPLAWNETNQKMTTQCLYPQAEDLGLLKMDLLGLKNLGVITRVMQECFRKGIPHNSLTGSDAYEVLADKKILEDIFSTGRTKGVFQFESDGMTKMLKDFKPESFDDIVLLVAAYRPGPLDFIPEIIAQKWHEKDPEKYPEPNHKVKIKHPALTNILAPTYGVPIYQEQVMKIFQDLAGYDLTGADNVRRFMSKKKTDKLEHERDFFIYGSQYVYDATKAKLDALSDTPENAEARKALTNELAKIPMNIKGCVGNGICTAEEANEFFDQLIEFSKYAFNKSHALCYAQVAMYTAYQKEYFPDLFYKYSLSNESKGGGENPVPKYISEMESFGIKILPPALGKSKADYEICEEDGQKAIRMGYGNIKGLSYEDYNFRYDNVLDFTYRNPDIGISTLLTFANLGMFDKIFNYSTEEKKTAEKERVNGNRGKICNFIKDYAQVIKDCGHIRAEISALKPLAENSSDVRERLEALNASFNELWGKITEQAHSAEKFPAETEDEKMDLRSFEIDKLGTCFSAGKEIDILKKYKGKFSENTYLNVVSDPISEIQSISVPCIVISKKERKKPGKGPKFIFDLMDRDGNKFQASSFDDILLTKGLFAIRMHNGYAGVKYATPFPGYDYSKLKAVPQGETESKDQVVGTSDGFDITQ